MDSAEKPRRLRMTRVLVFEGPAEWINRNKEQRAVRNSVRPGWLPSADKTAVELVCCIEDVTEAAEKEQ